MPDGGDGSCSPGSGREKLQQGFPWRPMADASIGASSLKCLRPRKLAFNLCALGLGSNSDPRPPGPAAGATLALRLVLDPLGQVPRSAGAGCSCIGANRSTCLLREGEPASGPGSSRAGPAGPWIAGLSPSPSSLTAWTPGVQHLAMDRFLRRGPLGSTAGRDKRGSPGRAEGDAGSVEEGGGTQAKRPRRDTASRGECLSSPWRHVQAEGLSCDYKILFSKAEADAIFRELEKDVEYFEGELTKLHVFGKWHSIPRKQVTYGDAGLTYTYSGVTFSPKPWIPVLDRIRDRLHRDTGHSFNFVLINRYKDGQDHMGEHRDDERELVPRSPIASVSFGASRDFVFRHGASRGKAPSCRLEPVGLLLEHGSLLLMNFPTNRHWYHRLPRRKKVLAPRINLTFRKVRVLQGGPGGHVGAS